MNNFIAPGSNGLTITAPTGGVTAGQLVAVGCIVGVAACTAAAGAQVEISPEGIFDLAKTPADSLAAGSVAKVTLPSTVLAAAGTSAVGWVLAAAGAGTTTARVRLVPSVASPPTVLAAEHEPAAAPHGRKSAA